MIVIIILSSVAIYVVLHKTRSASVIPSTSQSTTDWKTYRSDEYRFEFKYPPTWVVNHGKEGRFLLVCDEKLATRCGLLPEGVIASFTITVMDNREGSSLEQYVLSPAHGPKVVKITTLGGEKALITIPRNLEAGHY